MFTVPLPPCSARCLNQSFSLIIKHSPFLFIYFFLLFLFLSSCGWKGMLFTSSWAIGTSGLKFPTSPSFFFLCELCATCNSLLRVYGMTCSSLSKYQEPEGWGGQLPLIITFLRISLCVLGRKWLRLAVPRTWLGCCGILWAQLTGPKSIWGSEQPPPLPSAEEQDTSGVLWFCVQGSNSSFMPS